MTLFAIKRCHLFLLLLTLPVSGCMSADQADEKQLRKQVYVDANLQFELSYPEVWVRTQRPADPTPLSEQTTTWQIEKEQLSKLSILSLPVERNPYGYAGLETLSKEQDSALIITGHEETTFPAGAVRKLNGQTADSTVAIWLFLGKQRHYIIKCSAATAAFEQYRQQFEQVVDSFRTLD